MYYIISVTSEADGGILPRAHWSALATNRMPGGESTPLQGVPMSIKDLDMLLEGN